MQSRWTLKKTLVVALALACAGPPAGCGGGGSKSDGSIPPAPEANKAAEAIAKQYSQQYGQQYAKKARRP
jgi:hypothetical protein